MPILFDEDHSIVGVYDHIISLNPSDVSDKEIESFYELIVEDSEDPTWLDEKKDVTDAFWKAAISILKGYPLQKTYYIWQLNEDYDEDLDPSAHERYFKVVKLDHPDAIPCLYIDLD